MERGFEKDGTRQAYLQIMTALLCEPEEEILNSSGLFIKLNEVSLRLEPTVEQFTQALINLQPMDTKKLLVEYSRLFIGPFGLPAPPYSSLYLGSRQLNNEITDWVREFYVSCGLHFDDRILDLPDHVAIETEFLTYLLDKKLQAIKEGNEDLADLIHSKYIEFVKTHFLPWTQEFSSLVCKETNQVYFQNLFQLFGRVNAALV